MEMENQATGTPDSGDSGHWLDERKNIDRIFWGLVGTCAILVVLQIVVDRFVDPHAEFDLQTWPGFYGVFGYVAFLGIVLAGKYLRKLVMREEDYYVR